MSTASPNLRRVASYQGEIGELQSDSSMFVKSAFPGPHRTQLPPRAVLVGGRSLGDQWPRWRVKASCLFTSFLVVLFLLYLSAFSHASRVSSSVNAGATTAYGIVIDAGSSGCRLHVYKYSPARPVPQIYPADLSLKIKPGLSSFADNPAAAGASLTQLVQFAQDNVPASMRADTPLFLMATAGLRRVEERVAEEILESCRKVLSGSGFMFRPEWAIVISGTFEGVYAWVAANYALGNLGTRAAETTGVVELGGASAQVTAIASAVWMLSLSPQSTAFLLGFL
jgi:hypothetical protein